MIAPTSPPEPGGQSSEAGFVLVFFAGLMVVLLGLAAILIDLGQERASRRDAQSIADMAALGGGKNLSLSNPGQACRDIITYFDSNATRLATKISASSFCSQLAPVDIASTECSGGSGQAKPVVDAPPYRVQIVYPVYDSDIRDANFTGTGTKDGTYCDRMAVKVTVTNPAYFSRVLGATSTSTTRTAVVKKTAKGKAIPALWLLDPTGCVSLAASGGAQLSVGDTTTSPPIPGLVTIDSDGTKCTGTQTTISSTGSGTVIQAVPTTGPKPGAISLFALPPRATVCSSSGHACDPSDVSSGAIKPQPTPVDDRATRSPVDWRYNCKSLPGLTTYAYPSYHGITLPDCDTGAPAYIDQLVARVGTSGSPGSSFSTLTNCSPSGTLTVTGNVWVNCGTFSVGNGTNVTFNGNVVFQGDVSMSNGGSITVNGGTGPLSTDCATAITAACLGSSSPNAAIVYQRTGDLTVTGGTLTFNHAFLYQKSGALKDNGAAPKWSPPLEGPFSQRHCGRRRAPTTASPVGAASAWRRPQHGARRQAREHLPQGRRPHPLTGGRGEAPGSVLGPLNFSIGPTRLA
ncbi:MAG: hypothetical protein QOI86_1234 [Actinomycetota bacterium]|nr:hypothetical protein [Actinomycetota bacterium]